MIGLVARDALHDAVLVVPAGARPGDLARRPARGTVCAVFDPPEGIDPSTGEVGVGLPAAGLPAAGFRGLVASGAATRTAGQPGTFAELAAAERADAAEPVAASLSLPETLRRLRTASGDALPVMDGEGLFLGAVTPGSITAALLRREQELLKKSREYRASVHDDKRRRFETVRRLERMNLAFRKLLGLVARPPGRELFQEGIEALAMATDARFGAVQVLEAAPADDAEPGREAARAGRHAEDGAPATPEGHADDGDEAAFRAQRRLLLQQVLRGNRVVSIADAPTYLKRAGVAVDRPMLKTFLGVPVGRGGRVFGAVYLCDKAEGPFNDDDETLAAGFARGLASAMAQAREAGQRRRAERQRDLVNHLAREPAAADTFDKVAAAMLAATEEYWGWDAFSFSVRRSGRGRFRTLLQRDHANDAPGTSAGYDGPAFRAARARTDEADADRGAEQAELASGRPPTQWGTDTGTGQGIGATRTQPNERRVVLQEILAGRPVLFNRDPATSPEPGTALKRFGDTARPSVSLVYAPVRVDAETLGVVSLHSYRPGFFTEADRELLLRLADGAGPALARCEAERRGRVLGGLGHGLSTTVTPNHAARVVAAAADELLGFDACTVYLFDTVKGETHGVLMIDMVDGARVEITPKQPVGPASPLALKVMSDGPQIILRTAAAFDTPGTGPSPFGDRGRPSLSLMYAPLRTAAGPNGVLSIQSYEPDRYDARDLALLQELADFCSGALERTRTRE